MHHDVDQACGDHAGPDIVAALGGPAHEGQLLREARPVGGHDVGPHVVRVPGQALAGGGQVAGGVDEHQSGGDLQDGLAGQREPVGRRQRAGGVEPGAPGDERGDVLDPHPVPDLRVASRREPDGVTGESLRQDLGEVGVDLRHRLGRHQQGQPQPPVVVPRDVVVVPEHLGPGAQEPGGVRQSRPARGEDGGDDLVEVGAGERGARCLRAP